MREIHALSLLFALVAGVKAVPAIPSLEARAPDVDSCPGYIAKNVIKAASKLTADLKLAGKACNIYGADIAELRLEVTYDDDSRIHVKIFDPNNKRYEVPEDIFPRPASSSAQSSRSHIRFDVQESPFAFQIVRKSNGEKLFDTTGHPLVFENQYLRLKTNLPEKANIYGLGEHSETLRLDTKNTTRTMWARDAFGIPRDSNLYGVHPIYIDHRKSGSHGVFLLNSNGMDIKLRETGGTSLEYNAIGGVFDIYFFAGPSPADVSRQYAKVAGMPAMTPYWHLGLHQCKWGYRDAFEVAEVIANYSKAEIPLETMWTDIDYMGKRLIFTLDEGNFPLESVRDIVDYLHSHNQQYIMMVDPAVGYTDYPTFNRGVEDGVFLKESNGTIYKAVVWPGVTAYPDFMHPNATSWWSKEFRLFFNPDTGIDIDGLWIDMNEPTNFCDYPCVSPEQTAIDRGMPPVAPPVREPPRELPGFQFTQPQVKRREVAQENLIDPPYAIANDWPNGISDRTADTSLVHHNGITEYDAHNLYGTYMSLVSRQAMLSRRPGLRPVITTRSTFAGAGAKVFKWLGDNNSSWDNYRGSIAHMLGFASIYQIPVVGSDVCGFGGNTTETLCARWATLGAFYPFYRNHNTEDTAVSQEFYRWESVTRAAKKAIDIRYRLLDYIYTALQQQHTDGTPALNPLFFAYPEDGKTYGVDMQFLYGSSILVSPVTEEGATSVDIYLPKDIFYEFESFAPVQGNGQIITLSDVDFDSIPLHIKGGAILPMRVESAMTTAELRKKDFELVIAPGTDNRASGTLYLDDGVSIEQEATIDVSFKYFRGVLETTGKFGFDSKLSIKAVKFLGIEKKPRTVHINDRVVDDSDVTYDKKTKVLVVVTSLPLTEGFVVRL